MNLRFILVALVLLVSSCKTLPVDTMTAAPHPGLKTLCESDEVIELEDGTTMTWADTAQCKEAEQYWNAD